MNPGASRGRAWIWAAAALLACCVPPAFSQEPTNADCLGCHADSTAVSGVAPIPGLYGHVAGGAEAIGLLVRESALAGTPHADFTCVTCHQGIAEIPHPDSLPPVECAGCHTDQGKAVASGVHARAGPGGRYTPLCANCHGAHRILPASDPASPVAPGHLPSTCGDCHNQTALMQRLGVPSANPVQGYLGSVHWRFLGQGIGAATCTDCHRAHDILLFTDRRSPVYKTNIPHTCGRCHGEILEAYGASVHGTALAAGNMDAPSCADCHGEHTVESPQNPTSTVYPVNVTRTCAGCHGLVRLNERYGLPSEVVKTYQASFHGLASQFGETQVANCASCHTAHSIFPSADPRSSVNPANLAATCGQCHPGATAAFARTPIHLVISETRSPVLYWIRRAYILLLVAVLGGLGLHSLLDFIRRYRDVVRELRPSAVHTRMTRGDLAQHWLLLGSFFILVITGFALKSPNSFWSLPFRIGTNAFAARGWIHRGAALVLIATAGWHLAYIVGTARGRRFFLDMLPTTADVRQFREQIRYYFGLRRREAQFGRFSYVEKIEYLALLWGTAVMTVTGLALWFKGWTARAIPGWGFSASEIIHFYEAVLAFATIIIWHLYNAFVHAERPPYNITWLTGKTTRPEGTSHAAEESADPPRPPEGV